MSQVTKAEDIAALREGGKRLARILRTLREEAAPGKTTKSLDARAEELIRNGGDVPAFLGYKPHFAKRPFSGSLCISVNDEVVHGIPDEYHTLEAGDMVTIDLGLIHHGLYTDAALTFTLGKPDPDAEKLMRVTQEALAAGIAAARPGGRIGDISAVIQEIGERNGFGVPEWLGGHGVGFQAHDEPDVPNTGRVGKGPRITAGMVLAIEPIFNEGTDETELLDDGYTVVTADGKRSAQFEHTVLITEKGPEILTRE